VRLEMPGAKPRAQHFSDREVYDFSARAWLALFLKRWIGGEAYAADLEAAS
jgi:GMP synthase (glutamine-hydrolysing)